MLTLNKGTCFLLSQSINERGRGNFIEQHIRLNLVDTDMLIYFLPFIDQLLLISLDNLNIIFVHLEFKINKKD